MAEDWRLQPCDEWSGARTPRGYGVQWFEGRLDYAHRVAWKTKIGPIPDDMVLDHLCRNPPCRNVLHLDLVTHAENCRRGVGAKITAELATEIRALAQYGMSTRQIAALPEIPIGKTAVHMVTSGGTWR
jgi:hypothetical protein